MRARIVSPIRWARSTQPFLLEHVEDGDRGRERDGVADVGAADRVVPERVHDLGLAEHAGQRQPAGDRLGHRDQVRLDAVVLDGEHPPGAPEARLHLVGDEQDPFAVADRAQPLHELERCRNEAALALHRLDDDRGDRLGGDLRRERALERVERVAGA